ncbi:MAG: DUF1559 domain-containing protein [Pirellulaceae bacterium]
MSRRRTGFTLVELLVVIAIIGVLVALLLPAVQYARESARAATCWNNQKQLGVALHLFHDTHRRLPPGWTGSDPDGPPGWGWCSEILPQLEQNDLWANIRRDLPIDDPLNQPARETPLPILLCPSDGVKSKFIIHGGLGNVEFGNMDVGTPLFEVSRTNYVGVFGTDEIEDAPHDGNGTFYFKSQLTLADLHDGLSNTLVVGERQSRLGGSTWTGVIQGANNAKARIVGIGDHPPNHPHHHFDDFTSNHPNGVHFLLGDGSVKRLHNSIHEHVYRALMTRDGHEELQVP